MYLWRGEFYMTKLYELMTGIQEEQVCDKIEPDKLERTEAEAITRDVLKKIRGEQETQSLPRKKGSHSRRICILAAALIGLLAFGAIAYATELFGFGKVIYLGEETQTVSLEDSNQYKAMKEYREYVENLPPQKLEKLEQDQARASKGAMTDESYTRHSFAPDKAAELCKKYNLKMDKKDVFAKTAAEAFEKSGTGNFLGRFADNGKGQYSYTENGSVSLIMDGNTYCDFTCTPNDVFTGISGLALSFSDEKNIEQWDYVTKSGHRVKCFLYQDGDIEDDNSMEVYEVVIPAGNYVVTMCMSDSLNDEKGTYSKEKLEKIVEQLDLNQLT